MTSDATSILTRRGKQGVAEWYVRDLIERVAAEWNPKYTGYNVWGRNDKRRGRPQIRPREEWVWSPTPTHEVIISKELFDMVEQRATRHIIRPPLHGRSTPPS